MPDTTIACLGLGGMGAGLAHRLLDHGHRVIVYNRTPRRAAPLVAEGAVAATTPAGAVAGADRVLISLADEAAVHSVLFGAGAAAPALVHGAVVVDTSTISPAGSRELGATLAARGVRRVEACLLGNPAQARSGQLRVLAAGEPDDVAEVSDLLDALGHQVVRVGGLGSASSMKLVFNALLGAQLVSLAEAVAYGERAGLDRDLMLGAIAASGFSSVVMSYRCAVMRDERFTPPGFRSTLMEKDLRLIVDAAAGNGMALPVIAAAAARFADIVAAGDGDLDAAVILRQQLTDAGFTPDPIVQDGSSAARAAATSVGH